MARSELSRRVRPNPALLLVALTLAGVGLSSIRFRPKVARGQVAPPMTRARPPEAYPMPPELANVDLLHQPQEAADQKSFGCIQCHAGSHDPHYKDSLRLGCTDCHGGNPATNIKQ